MLNAMFVTLIFVFDFFYTISVLGFGWLRYLD